ncbi:MAG: TetR/AcrR family transcriptional regulator [Spongiibacteraceae bacterium]
MSNNVKSSAKKVDSINDKVRSSSAEQSINRILDATMEALSRQGLNSLSMTDVCRIAGVARGTLYRYFPSKEVLLESLGQRTRQETSLGITNAAASAASGKESLIGIINFLKDFAEVSKARATLEIEPLFFMNFLRRHLAYYAEVVTEALDRFYDEMEEGLGHKVDRLMCSEVVLRLQISYIFIPDNLSSEQLANAVLTTLNDFVAKEKA